MEGVPCLGITIVGEWIVFGSSTRLIPLCNTLGFEITFYAIVFLGRNQYRFADLTSGLLCHSSAEGGDGRRSLYFAFVAAAVLMARIWKDTKTFINNPPPTIPDSARYFPNLSALPTYNEGLPGT